MGDTLRSSIFWDFPLETSHFGVPPMSMATSTTRARRSRNAERCSRPRCLDRGLRGARSALWRKKAADVAADVDRLGLVWGLYYPIYWGLYKYYWFGDTNVVTNVVNKHI